MLWLDGRCLGKALSAFLDRALVGDLTGVLEAHEKRVDEHPDIAAGLRPSNLVIRGTKVSNRLR